VIHTGPFQPLPCCDSASSAAPGRGGCRSPCRRCSGSGAGSEKQRRCGSCHVLGFITRAVTASTQTACQGGEQEFPAIKSFRFILAWHQPGPALAESECAAPDAGGKAGACLLLPGLCSPPAEPQPLLGARLPSLGPASFSELTDAITHRAGGMED